MRRMLNTLYVTSEGAHLRKDGETMAVDVDGTTRARTPAHLLGQIVCLGQVSVSPAVLGFAMEVGISVSFLSYSGRLLGRVEGPMTGNVLLRRAQHAATADPARSLPVARAMVAAKLANQRAVLRRHLRDHADAPGREAVEAAETRLYYAARLALSAPDLDALRGQEGDGGAVYWSVFPHLLRNPDLAGSFRGRSRRPPLDPVNALLSFLYVLLAADARAACEVHGLDPQMGFLHRDRPGRMSLALDLMEEFRAPMADRVALTLVNRRQMEPADFEHQETGAVLLTERGRRAVIEAWQARKRNELRHAWFDEAAPLGLFPQLQAQLLARHLRGELDGYPAFLWG
ncbi:type I-C CRISPR-associated endonuclease Cas1c [Paracoccus luteus]|uniref:type I-C CRISPR-associated endonuclease Cas1c n=1 Tax=Paracoccus luteus TaxID=2508543 RepID=UPI00106FA5D8|nr:type I-C CRISPR-associated endonuclease Cas1c [Paracoccus luteus]